MGWGFKVRKQARMMDQLCQKSAHSCACGAVIEPSTPTEYEVDTPWGRVHIVRCPACNLAQERDFPTDRQLLEMYKSDNVYKPPSALEFCNEQNRFSQDVENIRALGIVSGTVLEIGCNAGYALGAFRNAGFEVVGVEDNDMCRECASKEHSITVVSSIDEIRSRSERFVVILLSHVLEHIPRISEFLNKVRVVAPEAVLYIKVPNYKSPYVRHVLRGRGGVFLPLQHVWYFEPKSLENLLKRYGYELINVHTSDFLVSSHPNVGRRLATKILGRLEYLMDSGHEIIGIFKPA